MRAFDLRRKHNGHCVIHNAFSEQQSVQIPVSMELIKDGQHRHCTQRGEHTLKPHPILQILQPEWASHSRRQGRVLRCTWVRGGDDGTEEKAVGVIELVSQLSDHLHQFDHAVHQIPGGGDIKTDMILTTEAPGFKLTAHGAEGERSPDDKTWDGSAKKCVGYDGAQVPEEVSLENEGGEDVKE